MRTSNKLLAIGIIALAVVAFSIPISSYYSDSHNLKKNTEGPLIHVSTVIEDAGAAPFTDYAGTSLNLSNVSVAIFSPVPDSLNSSQAFNLTGMNQTSNPYEVRLFQGHASSDGIINAHLSTEFFSIVREWLADIQNNTDQVSLMMYASYTHEYDNSMYVYSYYNNIPLDPRTPALLEPGSGLQSPFNISLYFDLSSPSQIIPLNGSNVISMIRTGTPEGQIGPPGGGSCRTQTDYTTVYDRTFTTELPEMAAVLGSDSSSAITYGFSSFSGSLEMSFNSVSKNTLDSYAVQSSSPSWSGTDSSFSASSVSSFSYPTPSSENASMIYIPGVSIHVVATEIVYQGPDGSSCEYTRGGTTTSITVTGISGDNFNPDVSFLSTISNSPYWYAIFDALSTGSVSSLTLPPSHTSSFSTFTADAKGYTNAADAEKTATNAVSVALASVGFGLAIGVAAGVIPGADSAVDAVDLVNEALAGASLNLAILSAFSSISYSTSLDLKYNSLNVGNIAVSGSGSTFSVNIYQASTQTQLNVGGALYSLNMPMTLIEAFA